MERGRSYHLTDHGIPKPAGSGEFSAAYIPKRRGDSAIRAIMPHTMNATTMSRTQASSGGGTVPFGLAFRVSTGILLSLSMVQV